MLFDTGGSGDVLLHNLAAVQVVPQSISALALSHAHRDHTGGLPALLARRAGLPLYAHPNLFRERFSQHGAEMRSVGMPLNQEDLGQVADLSLSDEPQEILPGVWTSGEITGRDEPEGRSSHHFIRQGETLVADPYRDDMSLLLETETGLVLICGCCHAGLLNTLAQVRQAFGRDPVVVMGGTPHQRGRGTVASPGGGVGTDGAAGPVPQSLHGAKGLRGAGAGLWGAGVTMPGGDCFGTMIRPLWQLLLDDPANLDCDECFAVMEYWAEMLSQAGVAILPDIQKHLVRCPDCHVEHRETMRRLGAAIQSKTKNGVNV